jgi:hypothetical protein
VEAKLVEAETKKRIEEIVNQRVEQEIERRKEVCEGTEMHERPASGAVN